MVSDGHVYGGGLTVDFTEVETLAVIMESGFDRVTHPSSGSNVATYSLGSEGSDQFLVTPRVIDPVVSRNLRGHSGVLEHNVSSEDEEYDVMYVPGVSVDVLGNDGEYGAFINIYDDNGGLQHVITEGSDDSFMFYVYPTSLPEGELVVNLVSESDRFGVRYLAVMSAPCRRSYR